MKRFSSLVVLSACAVTSCTFSISASAQTNNVDSRKQDRDALVESYKQLQQKPDSTATPRSEASLDAGVIIGLLQGQPALALQIKKILIKDALDQGRLLEQEDLTDAVLYD